MPILIGQRRNVTRGGGISTRLRGGVATTFDYRSQGYAGAELGGCAVASGQEVVDEVTPRENMTVCTQINQTLASIVLTGPHSLLGETVATPENVRFAFFWTVEFCCLPDEWWL